MVRKFDGGLLPFPTLFHLNLVFAWRRSLFFFSAWFFLPGLDGTGCCFFSSVWHEMLRKTHHQKTEHTFCSTFSKWSIPPTFQLKHSLEPGCDFSSFSLISIFSLSILSSIVLFIYLVLGLRIRREPHPSLFKLIYVPEIKSSSARKARNRFPSKKGGRRIGRYLC